MEHVRQAYASVAELYIELFGTSEKVHPDDLAFIEPTSGGSTRQRCSTWAAGPAIITGYLRSLGVDATGIDLVPEFIAHARAPTRTAGTSSGRWRTSPSPTIPSPASWPGTR